MLDRAAAVTGRGSAKTVLDNIIVQGIKAARDDKIIYVDAQAWYLAPGGVKSMGAILEDIKKALD